MRAGWRNLAKFLFHFRPYCFKADAGCIRVPRLGGVNHRAVQAIYDTYGHAAAVRSGVFLFVSGQVGVDATGTAIIDPKAQFYQAFANLSDVLFAAGCGFDNIVDVTSSHVSPYDHFDAFAAAKHAAFSKPPFPNWTAVGVVNLADPNLLLEIKVIAKLA